MSTTGRDARLDVPPLPTGRIVLEPPPELQPREAAGGALMNALPMLGSLGSVALVASMGRAGGGRALLAGGLFLLSTIGFVLVQVDRQRRQRRQQVHQPRTGYLTYLAGVRRAARAAAAQQRRALTWHHPDPEALPALAAERSRVWARQPGDPAFLRVRYGVADQPLALELVPPADDPSGSADPVAAAALRRLLGVHRLQPDLPATLDLHAVGRVELHGPDEQARSLARAMVCAGVAGHGPEQLAVGVLAAETRLAHWDWVKWLPHAWSGRRSDSVGPMRMVATTPADLATLLPADLGDRPRFGSDDRPAAPHLLLVVDGADLPMDGAVVPADGLHGVTVLELPGGRDDHPERPGLRIEIDGTTHDADDRPTVLVHQGREDPTPARADQCPVATAEALARRLTPLGAAG
ncbi:MAG TPA: type VII secretion protein EccC, partial [Nocardioides sp.]